MNAIAAITVTYHPDLAVLARQVQGVPVDTFLVVVDNGSSTEELEGIESLLRGRECSVVLPLRENRGLPAAVNHGARWLASNRQDQVSHVLLLDQDSVPRSGAIEMLHRALTTLEAKGSLAMVGPNLEDRDTGATHGFHCVQGFRWARTYPREGAPLIRCDSLNGSGTMVSLAAFMDLEGLDESLFIDHVDTEWSFHAKAAGFELFGIPGATFDHSMGESGRRFFWSGQRVWPLRSPHRHRFLFRNTVALMRRTYAPTVWKLWATPKLVLTAILFGVLGPHRLAQIRNMVQGLQEGFGMPVKRKGMPP